MKKVFALLATILICSISLSQPGLSLRITYYPDNVKLGKQFRVNGIIQNNTNKDYLIFLIKRPIPYEYPADYFEIKLTPPFAFFSLKDSLGRSPTNKVDLNPPHISFNVLEREIRYNDSINNYINIEWRARKSLIEEAGQHPILLKSNRTRTIKFIIDVNKLNLSSGEYFLQIGYESKSLLEIDNKRRNQIRKRYKAEPYFGRVISEQVKINFK